MGGRGAASGTGKHPYGNEYKTVLQDGNIKFVKYRLADNAKAPLETQTKKRIYVTVNGRNVIKFISFYDKENKRYKTIDLNGQPHYIDGKKEKEHTHFGYIHDEHGTKSLSDKEKKLIDRIISVWNNRHGKQ